MWANASATFNVAQAVTSLKSPSHAALLPAARPSTVQDFVGGGITTSDSKVNPNRL